MFKNPFGKKRIILGIGEDHTPNTADAALKSLYQMNVSNDAENTEPPSYYTPFYQLMEAAQESHAPQHVVQAYMKNIQKACSVLMRELQLLEEIKPDIVYIEGTSCPDPVADEARRLGAKVIHLDDGFEPYENFKKIKVTATDVERVERGREDYWAMKITKSGYRGAKEVLLAGAAHVCPEYIQDKRQLERFHSGKLPSILGNKGIKLEVLGYMK